MLSIPYTSLAAYLRLSGPFLSVVFLLNMYLLQFLHIPMEFKFSIPVYALSMITEILVQLQPSTVKNLHY